MQMQSAIQEINELPTDSSSPTTVTWSIDRTPDPNYLDNIIIGNLINGHRNNITRTRWNHHNNLNNLNNLHHDSYNYNGYNNNIYNDRNYLVERNDNTNFNILNTNNTNNTNNTDNTSNNGSIPFVQVSPDVEVILEHEFEVTDEERDCCVCFEKKEKEEICRLNCSHTFCVLCIDKTISSFMVRNIESTCPLCRVTIDSVCVQTDSVAKLLSKYS
jgi:hypothetical protein